MDINNKNTWQIIKKKRKRNNFQPQANVDFKISTSNQFHELQNEECTDKEETTTKNTDPRSPPTPEPKPPPIYIHGVANFKAMSDNLAPVVTPSNYHTKSLPNNTVIIYPHKPEIYRRLVSHLRENKIVFHTYQLKQDRAYRVVIKDIHPSVSTQDIAAELQAQGHQVRNIVNIRHRLTKEPLPLFFVDLEPNTNNKDIYDIQYLYNIKIRIEPPRTRRDIVQCTRCQDYGHSKSYCNRPFYCVKCGQQHDSKSCTKPKDTPASCALCQGNHPANYKGCSIYKELILARNNRNSRQPPTTPHKNPSTSNQTTPPPSRWNNPTGTPLPEQLTHIQTATPTHPLTPNEQINQFTTFLTDFKNLFSQLLNQNNMILSMLTTVVAKLTK
jgi:hypothetical protein